MNVPHRVLVCGGRDYNRPAEVAEALDMLRRSMLIETIIHGGARGADTCAGVWATTRGIPVEVYPAEWEKHGRRAGVLRNERMLNEGRPNYVVAFPGGRGTAHMVGLARAYLLPVWRPYE